MRFKKPVVLGVSHSVNSPDYSRLIAWIDGNVKPGMKVGLEYPASIKIVSDSERQFLKVPSFYRGKLAEKRDFFASDPQHQFFLKIIAAIQRKGAQAVMLDSSELLDEHSGLEEKKRLFGVFHVPLGMLHEITKVSAVRSAFMLERALKNQTDVMIVGSMHAADFSRHVPRLVGKVISLDSKLMWWFVKALTFLEYHTTAKAQKNAIKTSFQRLNETYLK
ncbi:MAG: hypothetical protein QXR53_01775 [Candidatus Norongarragalinales archaeon]